MTYLPDLIDDAEEGGSLRAQARLNEMGRRTSALTFRIGFLRWLVLPVFYVALVAMAASLILGFGEPGEVVGGIVGLGGAAAGLLHWRRQMGDEISDLEDERAMGAPPGAIVRGKTGAPNGAP